MCHLPHGEVDVSPQTNKMSWVLTSRNTTYSLRTREFSSNFACSRERILLGNCLGQIGWAPGKLDSIWTSSVRFVKQFYDGGVSSSHSSGEKRNECLWIHHFVILQLFHPKFRHCDNVNFHHENYSKFVRRFNSDDIKNYESIYGEHPRFNYLWLGCFV